MRPQTEARNLYILIALTRYGLAILLEVRLEILVFFSLAAAHELQFENRIGRILHMIIPHINMTINSKN